MEEAQLLRGILEGCVLAVIMEGETYGYAGRDALPDPDAPGQEGNDFLPQGKVAVWADAQILFHYRRGKAGILGF